MRLALRESILSHENEAHRHPDSPQSAHPNLFESRFDFLNWPDEPIKNFKSTLYEHLMRYISGLCGFTPADLQKLKFTNESWFHITRSGGFFQPHTHPLASVSLIYCVDPGDSQHDTDAHDVGAVMFTDPRQGASMYLDPVNRQMRRAFSFNGVRYRLAADDLCIFPSYLQHWVEPYVGASPRITIAANFAFQLRS